MQNAHKNAQGWRCTIDELGKNGQATAQAKEGNSKSRVDQNKPSPTELARLSLEITDEELFDSVAAGEEPHVKRMKVDQDAKQQAE